MLMEIHSRFRVRCCLMLNVEYKVVKRAKIAINVINFESISEGTIPLMSKTIVCQSINQSIIKENRRFNTRFVLDRIQRLPKVLQSKGVSDNPSYVHFPRFQVLYGPRQTPHLGERATVLSAEMYQESSLRFFFLTQGC